MSMVAELQDTWERPALLFHSRKVWARCGHDWPRARGTAQAPCPEHLLQTQEVTGLPVLAGWPQSFDGRHSRWRDENKAVSHQEKCHFPSAWSFPPELSLTLCFVHDQNFIFGTTLWVLIQWLSTLLLNICSFFFLPTFLPQFFLKLPRARNAAMNNTN